MKVGVVGAGLVGSTATYALVMRGIAGEIVLVDKDSRRAQAEADDISHAVPFVHPVRVVAGEMSELAGSRVVILAAGAHMQPGESRLELLERNALVFQQVVPQVLAHAPESILLVATNPVDVMTHLAAQYATQEGVSDGQILGSGTTLDTARFRALLGSYLGVDAQHVHAYVVGEHSDSEVLTWSLITVGGIPLVEYCQQRRIALDDSIRRDIDRRVRGAAYSIIAGKGHTYYGIGAALGWIVDAILHDHRAILTVCAPTSAVEGVTDVTLSLPRLVGGTGIQATFPLPLGPDERALLRESALAIRHATDALDGTMAR